MKVRSKIKISMFGGMIFIILAMAMSCESLKETEKENYDSLFLGISLSMGKQEFYDYCWEMNKKKLFIHGPTNQAVEYTFKEGFDHPVVMHFYPSFHNDKIYEMPVTYNFEAWAPWNRQFQSDSLLSLMLAKYKQWYGNDFKLLNHPTQGKVYYKMDGRRRINLFIRDDQYVQAVFTDLKAEKEIKEQKSKEGAQ